MFFSTLCSFYPCFAKKDSLRKFTTHFYELHPKLNFTGLNGSALVNASFLIISYWFRIPFEL